MNGKGNLRKVIKGILEVARPEIRKHFHADSCIASTRTLIRVFSHFGIYAEPMAISALVYNPEFVRAIKSGDMPPDARRLETTPELRAWMDRLGAWSVGIGIGDTAATDPRGLPGLACHMVAVVRAGNAGMIIDAAIDQASRPERNIHLPPVLIMHVKDEFTEVPWMKSKRLTLTAPLTIENAAGLRVTYAPIAEAPDWRTARNWSDKSQTKKPTQAIISYIEGIL